MSVKTVDSQTDLAGVLGVSRAALRAWRRRGAPIGERGPYDVERVRAWAKANLTRSKLNDVRGDADLRRKRDAAHVRWLEATADKHEERAKRMRAGLIGRNKAASGRRDLLAIVKRRLLAIPKAHSSSFVGIDSKAEVECRLTEIITQALRELAEGLQ